MDLTQAEAVIDLIEAETADAAANAAGQVGGALTARLEPVYEVLTDLCSHFHAVLDYPDEEIDAFSLASYEDALSGAQETLQALLATANRGRVLRNGVRAVILGKPNVGKSSLLNALAGFQRVIVTEQPGTTRDTVEESVLVGSVRLRLTDTAGIRDASDQVEALGWPARWRRPGARTWPCLSATAAVPWSRRTRTPWKRPGRPGMPSAC